MNNTSTPKVSICIASYNHQQYIGQAIESILSQSYQNWELIIVDDCSTDNSKKIIQDYVAKYPDKIRAEFSAKNNGVCPTLNRAIKLASGELVAQLGSDDAALPDRLEKQVDYLQHNQDIACVCSLVNYINDQGEPIQMLEDVFAKSFDNIADDLLKGNFINAPSVMFRKDVFDQLGGFNEALTYTQDFDLWLRMIENHKIGRINECLIDYRVHGKNISMNSVNGTLAFASVYETVSCILRAVDRITYMCANAADENVARYKLQLAQICLENDINFFGKPFLGSGKAYTLVLEAIDVLGLNEITQPVLNQVYNAIGDSTRVKTGRSASLVDWLQETTVDTQSFSEEQVDAAADYQLWVDIKKIKDNDLAVLDHKLSVWSAQPTLHIIINAQEYNFELLPLTLESLLGQIYPAWGASIVSDIDYQADYLDNVDNIEWIQIEGSYKQTVDQVIKATNADWVMLIDAGDVLDAKATFSFAEHINNTPSARFIYADEDQVNEQQEYVNPDFKPDFNLELLYSTSYVGTACIISSAALEKVGGVGELTILQNYYLSLKTLSYFGKESIEHASAVLLHRNVSNLCQVDMSIIDNAGHKILSDHLAESNINASVAEGYIEGTYRVIYNTDETPLVSIIIPNKDSLDILEPCIESILKLTRYKNYEIIVVDNNSVDRETFQYYERLLDSQPDKVRLLKYDEPFNFSAMNNMAAEQANGSYLLLLNNDTQIVQESWLERMLNQAMRPEVGVVGARLLHPDNSLQHAGVILGMDEIAGHPYIGQLPEMITDKRIHCVQNFSAVTAACLLIKKSVYDEVGGLDSDNLTVSYNDVDLCLKAGEAGYEIVWTPYATVVHHGSFSQKKEQPDESKVKRFRGEQDTMLERWLPKLAHDPAYNKNLSLHHTDCRVDIYFEHKWDVAYPNLPRVMGIPLTFGAASMYRIFAPLRYLHNQGRIEYGMISPQEGREYESLQFPTVAEIERLDMDTLLMQSLVQDKHLLNLERYSKFSNAFKVYDLEDLKTFIPDKNSRKQHMIEGLDKRVRQAVSLCDRLLVTTEPLADAHKSDINDIRVVPNYLPKGMWLGLQSKRRQGDKPRVGWAGAQQHHGDLELMIDVVRQTADEVDWIFMGMCIDELKPYVAEIHDYVPFEEYPIKLASLNLDLAVAPLELHEFNEAKSNLRLLEYGVFGWPVVCTDIYPYQHMSAPVKRVPNTTQAWIEAIRERAHDLDMAEKEGDALRDWVLANFMLEDNLDSYLAAILPG